jgi:hypothetical protein
MRAITIFICLLLSGIAGQISGVTSGDYRVVQVAAKFVF